LSRDKNLAKKKQEFCQKKFSQEKIKVLPKNKNLTKKR